MTSRKCDDLTLLCSIQVNACTFRGKQLFYFYFAFHLIKGSNLKEKMCSSMRKFLPLRVDPFLKGCIVQGSKQEVTMVVSLCKNNRKS